MKHSRPPIRLARVLAAAAIATITVLAASAPALAAKGGSGPKPPKPSASATATATATVSGGDVTVSAKVNRPAAEVLDYFCFLNDMREVDCSPAGGNKKSSTFGATVTGLEDGDYSFDVEFSLTDGTSAQASASFTVDNVEEPPPPPPGDAGAACASLSGTFTTTFLGWTCAYVTTNPFDGPDPVLIAACASDGEYSLTNHGDGTYTKSWTCPTGAGNAQAACGSYGGTFDWAQEGWWRCRYVASAESPTLVDSLLANCPEPAWAATQGIALDGRNQLVCQAL